MLTALLANVSVNLRDLGYSITGTPCQSDKNTSFHVMSVSL